MIHDAKVEVTCDGCHTESVQVEPEYVYANLSGAGGHYDCRDSEINRKLEDTHKWVVRDGCQYCCPECTPPES